ADDVYLEHASHAVGADAVDSGLRKQHRRIVDQRLERSAARVDGGEHVLDLFLAGDVGAASPRTAAGGDDFRLHGLRALGIAAVVDADIVPGGCQQLRGFGADAAAGAGDEGDGPRGRTHAGRAEYSCTASTMTFTWSGSMSGSTPWPRLNT